MGITDIKSVYVIIGPEWVEEDIVKELIDEKYCYDFYFGNMRSLDEMLLCISSVDEVWCFGNCMTMGEYDYAVREGCDIWQMV